MLHFLKKTFGSKHTTNPTIQNKEFLTTDVHSHLLPGIDDGVKTFEEAQKIISRFIELGYKKLITTPHIMQDFYKNTPEIILGKLAELKTYLAEQDVEIELEAAAEYYFDDWFIKQIEKEEKLLTFGDNYILFETSFLNKPRQLFEVVFELQAQGYKPVFAHPERYNYVYDDFEILEKLIERGVILQLNLNSIVGYYGKNAKMIAELLIDQNMIQFAGTDCHGHRHLEALVNVQKRKYFTKLAKLELLNQHI